VDVNARADPLDEIIERDVTIEQGLQLLMQW
jgi:hypothetical protein